MSAFGRKIGLPFFLIVALCGVSAASRNAAADEMLDIVVGGKTRQFARDALLSRPDAADLTIVKDVSYSRTMSYRAVPLAALLAGLDFPPDSVIEAIAHDGFAAQLPLDLIANTDPGKPIAWLAVEPADHPWPPLPGKTASAGPFYIVWTGNLAATIRSEQWPYQVAKLASEPSPATRWPALGVDARLPATDPVRAGQALFVTQCLPCHTLNGAGNGAVGPELNSPRNPTEYLTPAGLRALIRNPKSLRTWPEQRMPGFSEDQMSDREIDLVIGYLAYMTARRTSP